MWYMLMLYYVISIRTLSMLKITFLFLLIFTVFGSKSMMLPEFNLTSLIVPEVVDFRESVNLTCSYNLGLDYLNSLKWYKDNKEFFRYTPISDRTYMNFDVIGVTLNREKSMCNNEICTINLINLNQTSTGTYQCEISGEAPAFKLISRKGNMTIAALPQHEPSIEGIKNSYEIGDFLVANCTSDKSDPPSKIIWYINDKKVPEEYLQRHHQITTAMNGFILYSYKQEIRFRIDVTHFSGFPRLMILKCFNEIEKYPEKSVEKSVTVYASPGENLMNEKLIVNNRSVKTMKLSFYVQLATLTTVLLIIVNIYNN